MQLFVAKNGQQLGPFEEAQVRTMLAEGSISGGDLAWHAALPNWVPLSSILTLPTASVPPVLPQTAAPGVPPYGAITGYGSPGAVEINQGGLADRVLRLGAVLIDFTCLFLITIPTFLLSLIGGKAADGSSSALASIGMGISVLLFLALAVYQIYLLCRQGQTIGKRIVRVRIVRTSGAPVDFVHVLLLRSFVPGLIGAIPFLGLLFTLVDICFIFSENRRCLHDLIADTKVVTA